MKFFIDKEYAHRNTRLFLWLFVANVLIISALNAALIYYLLAFKYDRLAQTPKLFLIPFFISIMVFVIACYYSILRLSDGGKVATMLGGRLLQFPLTDESEKRLYNVVEEMSIASGTPVPFVFVLDGESSINAFAAGSDPKNAAVAVTEGAMKALTRDELQAIIGHEFSHILHDDMELNSKVAGAVNGFMFFMKMGEVMLRGNRSSSTGKRKADGSAAALWIFALGIYILGSVGFFLGRYMQSLISQQREYLADASSAQFTRNPAALAQALAKIYNGHGSALSKGDKYELAHIFFADGLSSFASQFFKTHPPLLDRIGRLLPEGSKVEEFIFEKSVRAEGKENAQRVIAEVHKERIRKVMDENPQDIEKLAMHASAISMSTLQALRVQTDEHIKISQELLAQIPDSARSDLQNPDNAKANLLSVVISTNDQPDHLIKAVSEGHPDKMPLIERNLAMIRINTAIRLLLFQLSLSPLRTLSKEEKSMTWTLLFNAFQSDQTLTFTEALFLFLAKQALMPPIKTTTQVSQKPSPFHAAAVARISYWFGLNVSDQELRNDIELITGIPVPKIPEQKLSWLLFEDQLSKLLRLDLNNRQKVVSLFLKQLPIEHPADQGETFRLLSLCLGVPIPPLVPSEL